jgi:biofilm protein TabA
MILDRLDRCDRYLSLHPGFARAFEFLKRPDLASIPDGKYPVAGDDVFALVQHPDGRGPAAARPEFHRKYIDIQYTVAGGEIIGWRALADSRDLREGYDEGRDVGFFGETPESWVRVGPGSFAIFFPEDVHAPLAGEGPMHKVVMKIVVSG